jgi:RimJ/RimL family protein N-acetyltransferase
LKLKARPATIKDKARLLAWANDQEIRRQSFMTRRITKQEHDQWFSKVLADHNNQRLFILENHDTSPCGQVRFSRSDGDDWEIHFSMDAQYRRRGMGSEMLRVGLDAFLGKQKASLITAKVKINNYASLKVLAKAGFQITAKSVSGNLEAKLIYTPK